MNRVMLPCCALLVLVAGFGGKGATGPSLVDLNVQIMRVLTYPASNPLPTQVDNYSLTCNPPAGTLPLADRLCRDIGEHLQAMIAPRNLLPSKGACVTPGVPGDPSITLTVEITSNGATTLLGPTNCGDPGSVARTMFYTATLGDEGLLAQVEPALRCDEDPVASIFATLSRTNREACMFGSWTDSNRKLIQLAEHAPAVAALDPTRLFPIDPGARVCAIPIGGAVKGRSVKGQCGAYVTGETISFVEDWSGQNLIWLNASNSSFARRKGTDSARHTWEVLVVNGVVKSVAQSGSLPPQRRRH